MIPPTTSCLLATTSLFLFVGCGAESPYTTNAPAGPSAPSAATSSPIAATSSKNNGSSPHAAGKTAKPANSETTTDSAIDPGKTEWKGDDAKHATIPEHLPVYGNSTPVGGTASSRMFVFEWSSNDAKKDVMDFFRKRLPDAGYKIESEASYGSFEATKDGEALSVWIGSPPKEPVSILVRLEYK